MQLSPRVFKIFIVVLHIFLLSSELHPLKAETWIRAGYYWYEDKEFLISNIDSSLFTHLICGFADVNLTSYQLSLSPSAENHFSAFTKTVKQKNPSVTTLLSIGKRTNHSTFSTMVSNSSYRKSFIDSSIKIARLYGFQGLDLWWVISQNITSSDSLNMGILFKEWRATIELEARNSSQPRLILTTMANYSPNLDLGRYPIDFMKRYLNWIHFITAVNFWPTSTNFTAANVALYNPTSDASTDTGVKAWINAGLPAKRLVMCLPYYGFAWTLANSKENGIGAPATGPAMSQSGSMGYDEIKDYIERYEAKITYNETYVVNYCTIGTTWIGFDDVEAVRSKVSYAKEKRLLGYMAWQVSYDDKWVLSQAAETIKFTAEKSGQNGQRRLLVIVLPTTAAVLLIGSVTYYKWKRKLKLRGKEWRNEKNNAAAAGDFYSNDPNLTVYRLVDIEAATDGFSIENKLGEGGYGPVYKGILPDGLDIAVKKLSKASKQGFEEFKNEVVLTAKLQHVNLVKLLGFCMDKEEHMLIYEYMPNKSLDSYLFDPVKRYMLNWEKRINIIEGICQGLLYLQEYSRLTIIHRDLKASNVLLDKNMRAKISDFGMARIFSKDNPEANTGRIVGTYGYVPPEYVRKGTYSIKSDVYSFGVLLLQIISGKRILILYGENDHLTLLEYAYELWKNGKGMELMETSLDDTYSSCRLIRCLQIALLCVQENPIERPSMLEVFSMLRNESIVLKNPKKPAFSKQSGEDVQYGSTTSNLEICSINDTTLSNLEAR